MQRLKLEYHKMLSTFAFNFNLRRYTVDITAGELLALNLNVTAGLAIGNSVRRRSFTLSNPR